ncbi:hypothetical protein REPUB_Repub15cG0040600 [Reevesia pubescens]
MDVTYVFVNNIPKQVHWRWLWRIFSHHGKVVDVLIPKKRSKSGRRYGFIRFSNRGDAFKVIKRLNGVWLLNAQLGVNIARFKGRSFYWRKVSKNPSTIPASNFEVNNTSPDIDVQPAIGNGVLPDKKSYLQVLMKNSTPSAKSSSHHCSEEVDISSPPKIYKSCSGVIEEEALHSLESCVIGVERDYETNTLLENFRINGVSEVSLKKISGRQFLIMFEDKEFMSAMEEQQWCWLKEWFVEITLWSENFSLKFRVTWISCFGVPIHCWNYDTFKNIANIWGELISLDAKALDATDYSKGSLRIMTNQQEKIEDTIIVSYGKMDYTVRISEVGDEWISFFHCCCKPNSNILPPSHNIQSDNSSSEDEQSPEVEQSPPLDKKKA